MRLAYLLLLFVLNLYSADPNVHEQAFAQAELEEKQNEKALIQSEIDLEEQLTPQQRQIKAAKAFIELQILLLQIIPPDKLEELNEKFAKSVGNLDRERQPTAEEIAELEASVKDDIDVIVHLVEIEADKSWKNKIALAMITFKQNMSMKTLVKTGVYRVAASLDSLLMTYLFITHNISVEAAFKTTAVDLVGKFFLYYAYERLWKAPWLNKLWKKSGILAAKYCPCKCKKK